ncbi:MAG TPA: aminodeoxychorismate synthase component I [Myxococcota bacterium]|nr:aminodeoxychorismate synthase component I [Myxococcota bacterium]
MSDAKPRSIVAASAVREIAPAPSLLPVAEALHERCGAWWLDSAQTGGALGCYSFAGAEPYAVVRAYGNAVEVETLRAVRADLPSGRAALPGGALDVFRTLLAPQPMASEAPLPFVGGAVGWLGYELAHALEPRLGPPRPDAEALPDLALLLVDRVVALEHATGRRFACALGFASDAASARSRAEAGAEAFAAELAGLPAPSARPALRRRSAARAATAPRVSLDASDHAKAVAEILERIEAGDAYQANLTHRFELPFAGDPWELYRALRASNPAPFAAWLALPEVAVCGASPERFVRLAPDGRVESRPIKGTRPRGADPASDAALALELSRSEKDRAENVMIVDLVRHDLGRVCATGSVAVPALRTIESFATVHHMVSEVTGRLREGQGLADLLCAAFPPGSMTGAPKLAAMRILAALEPVRRGIYAGALGWFDVRGGADLAVVIRTALVARGRARVHSGGAIVADSRAADEWRESHDKVRAVLDAVRATAGGWE